MQRQPTLGLIAQGSARKILRSSSGQAPRYWKCALAQVFNDWRLNTQGMASHVSETTLTPVGKPIIRKAGG